MCAVMRIAVALDRCDTSAIEHVHVYQQPESVMLVSSLPSVSNLIRLHLLESFFLPFLTIDLASLHVFNCTQFLALFLEAQNC
jgi:hypothetical protein